MFHLLLFASITLKVSLKLDNFSSNPWIMPFRIHSFGWYIVCCTILSVYLNYSQSSFTGVEHSKLSKDISE